LAAGTNSGTGAKVWFSCCSSCFASLTGANVKYEPMQKSTSSATNGMRQPGESQRRLRRVRLLDME